MKPDAVMDATIAKMYNLNQGSLQLLSDDTVAVTHRLKLCRILWVSSTYNPPQKYQKLLNWICLQLNLKDLRSQDMLTLLKTLIEFLNSSLLLESLKHNHTVSIRPSIFSMLTSCLKKDIAEDVLHLVVEIDEILLSRKFLSTISSQFGIFSSLLVSWIQFLIRNMETDKSRDLSLMVDHVALLVTESKSFFRAHSMHRQAFGMFCENVVPELLKLHYKCSIWNQVNERIERLSSLVEQTIVFILFRRENFQFPDNFSARSITASEGKDKNRRNKKADQLKYSKKMVLSLSTIDAENKDMASPSQCLSVFMKLCLKHSKMEFPVKVKMFRNLTKLCCNCQSECTAVAECMNFDMAMFQSLLKVAIQERLYQAVLDRDLEEGLLPFLKDVLSCLMKQQTHSISWIQCITYLGKIDKSIIEENLKSILLKCVREYAETEQGSLTQLIHCITDAYVKDRQTVRLINIIDIVAEGGSSEDVNTNFDTVCEVIEEFGKTLGYRMRYELSGDLMMNILSIAVLKISEKVKITESENIVFPHIKCVDLLLRFLNKIVEQAPILMLWDHLSVRKELIRLLKQLDLSAAVLSRCLETKKDNLYLVQSYLRLTILLSMLEYQLTRYAITCVEDVKLCFENTTLKMCKAVLEDLYPTLTTNSSCLLLYLILSKMVVRELHVHCQAENDLEKTSCDDDMMSWLWNQLEKLLKNVDFRFSAQTNPVKEVDDSKLFKYFAIMTEFSPTILKIPSETVKMWLCNAVLHLIYKVKPLEGLMKVNVMDFFPILTGVGKIDFCMLLVMEASKFLSASCGALHCMSSEVLISNTEKIAQLTIDKLSEENSKVVHSALDGFYFVLEQLNLRSFDNEDILLLFRYLVYTALLVCHMLSTLPSDERQDNLGRNISLLLLCADGRSDLFSSTQCTDVILGIARIKSFGGTNFEEPISFLIRDMMISWYTTSPTKAYKKLQKMICSDSSLSSPGIQMDLIAEHVKSLIYLISTGDYKNKIVGIHPSVEGRKRKLRTCDETCKIMRLENTFDNEGDSIHDVIRKNLRKLYKESEKILKTADTSYTKNILYLRQSQMDSTRVLEHDDNSLLENIQVTFKSILDEVLSGRKRSEGDLKFLKSCLRCKDIQYDYDYNHLEIVLRLGDNECSVAKSDVEESASNLIARMPLDYIQEALLSRLYQCVNQKEKLKDMENFISVANFLLRPACVDFLFVQDITKGSRKNGHIFTKVLMQLVQIYLTRSLQRHETDVNVSSLIQANQVVCSLLKLKWAKFKLSEVSNIVSLLHALPLEHVYETQGLGVFMGLFESYVNVLHCIIVSRENVGNITALCLASLRRLLKAGLHVAEQKGKERSIQNASFANKCAGFLEKLFQLIADSYKPQFSKCVSYIIADYICLVSSMTIIPSTRKSFTSAAYHLLSIMDEYDVAMIRKALPNDIRDQFQTLYLDFKRKFKYKGFV